MNTQRNSNAANQTNPSSNTAKNIHYTPMPQPTTKHIHPQRLAQSERILFRRHTYLQSECCAKLYGIDAHYYAYMITLQQERRAAQPHLRVDYDAAMFEIENEQRTVESLLKGAYDREFESIRECHVRLVDGEECRIVGVADARWEAVLANFEGQIRDRDMVAPGVSSDMSEDEEDMNDEEEVEGNDQAMNMDTNEAEEGLKHMMIDFQGKV